MTTASPCCSAPLRNKGAGRSCCSTCGRYLAAKRRPSRRGTIRRDSRGRKRIWLGKGHVYANSGGWQWLGRYLVATALGRTLLRGEHVHHKAGVRVDRLSEYDLQLAEYHGRYHATVCTLAGWRDDKGRFVEHESYPPKDWPRFAAILGPASRGLGSR